MIGIGKLGWRGCGIGGVSCQLTISIEDLADTEIDKVEVSLLLPPEETRLHGGIGSLGAI